MTVSGVMFTLDDEFDVDDEDFLSNAFQTTANENIPNNTIGDCAHNGQQIIDKPFQDLRYLESTKNNGKNQAAVEKKNADFLELWKSNENNLFNARSQKKSDLESKIDISQALSPRGFKTEIFARVTKNVRSRKFPGPAGLLPERSSNTSFIVPDECISNLENDSEHFSEFEEQEVFSQNTNKLFEEPEGPWQRMIYDLGQLGKHLISTINLSTLQIKQTRNGFKVPFLAVCVQSIDCSLPDPSVILKDEKDEINGTLHRDVWEEWKGEIVIGSVLVLQNVGVISAGNSSRRYFLNITSKNIVTIYSPTLDSIKMIKINSSSKMDSATILNEWERLMKQNKTPTSIASENENVNRSLFSVFSPGPQLNSPVPPKPPPIRPQFYDTAKVRPRSLPLGRATLNNRCNSFEHNSNAYNKSSPHMPNQTSVQSCTPPLNVSQKISKDVPISPLLKRPRTMGLIQSKEQTKSIGESQSPNVKSIFNISDSSNSIVESVLDGIDTDSLFEDF